jgi:ribonuclease P protein component
MAVTSDPRAFRASRHWLALAGSVRAAGTDKAPVRFGFTAARRYARRAVDRNTVKRVLREAARQRIDELDRASADRAVDVVLRLRAGPPPTHAHAAWKCALREEADGLLAELAGRLRQSQKPG